MKRSSRGGLMWVLALLAGCLDPRAPHAAGGDARSAPGHPEVVGTATPGGAIRGSTRQAAPVDALAPGATAPDGSGGAADGVRGRVLRDSRGERIAVEPRMHQVVVARRGADGQVITRCVSQLDAPLQALAKDAPSRPRAEAR